MNIKFQEWLRTDSTLDVIKREIEIDPTIIHVVAARMQLAGRGQSDRTWESPEGNIYLSMYFPETKFHFSFKDEKKTWLPLMFAQVVSNWMFDSFKIRPLIKWPNDFLIQGEKIAGLLCEQISEISKKGFVFSVGINVFTVPSHICDQKVGCLSKYVSKNFLIKEHIENFTYARNLVNQVVDYFISPLKKEELQSFLECYFIGIGEIFKNEDQTYSKILGFDDEFHVRMQKIFASDLNSLNENKKSDEELLVSGMQIGKWIFQSPMDQPFVIADIGNSRIKLAVFESLNTPEPFLMYSLKHKDSVIAAWKQLEDIIPSIHKNVSDGAPFKNLHYASVSRENEKILMDTVPNSSWNLVPAKKRRIRSYSKRYTHKDEQSLGVDRIAFIEFMAWYFADSFSIPSLEKEKLFLAPIAIGVSFGSAITIDVMDWNGQHLGGYILPGYQVYFESLEKLSKNLKNCLSSEEKSRFKNRTDLRFSSNFIPEFPVSSVEAMDLGFYESILGMLTRVVSIAGITKKDSYTLNQGFKIPVVITGGYAKEFHRYCQIFPERNEYFVFKYEPLACIQGIRQMAFGPLLVEE